jgi:hypothetical protein
MTEDDVRQLLRTECNRYGISAFCQKTGVTRALVYAVLNGTRPPRGEILSALGLQMRICYERKARPAGNGG